MRSAFALRIFSGKIILYFGTPERLRTLRCSIFTGGVVTENGSCSAAFCESAALRESFLLPFSGLNPLRRSRASSLGEGASGETGSFAFEPETVPPCQRLPLGGSWQNRQVLAEGVRSKLSPVKTGERNVRRRSAPQNLNHTSAIDVHSERGAHLKWFYPNSTTA